MENEVKWFIQFPAKKSAENEKCIKNVDQFPFSQINCMNIGGGINELFV
jgi:hypothetical protein